MVHTLASAQLPVQRGPLALSDEPGGPPFRSGPRPVFVHNGVSSLLLVWYTGVLGILWMLLVRLQGNTGWTACDS